VNSEAGQTNTELGLILVILSLAVLVVATIVAGSVVDLFTHAGTLIDGALT
jgi:Flp pilus assembly pilin Flp